MIPYQHRKSNRSGSIFQDIRQGVLPASLPVYGHAKLKPFWEIFVQCWSLLPDQRLDAQTALLLLSSIDKQGTSNTLDLVREETTNGVKEITTTETTPIGFKLHSVEQKLVASDVNLPVANTGSSYILQWVVCLGPIYSDWL